MISRPDKELKQATCCFCGSLMPAEKIFLTEVSNATVCDSCVGFIREEMGLKKDRLQEIIDSA